MAPAADELFPRFGGHRFCFAVHRGVPGEYRETRVLDDERERRCRPLLRDESSSYANGHVAIARDPRQPDGAELESHRRGGRLPWFAKTALFVRGNQQVVVRVPNELSDAVRIAGWTQPPNGRTAAAVLVTPSSTCPEDWTAYPGGLVFRGRHCVRLLVEGPGDARGLLLVGLRRDCSAQAKG